MPYGSQVRCGSITSIQARLGYARCTPSSGRPGAERGHAGKEVSSHGYCGGQGAGTQEQRRVSSGLKRIELGEYGFCEETGEPIGLQRLEARPIATLSIEAQEQHERRERVYLDEQRRPGPRKILQ